MTGINWNGCKANIVELLTELGTTCEDLVNDCLTRIFGRIFGLYTIFVTYEDDGLLEELCGPNAASPDTWKISSATF